MTSLLELQQAFAAVAMGRAQPEALEHVLGKPADPSRARVQVYADAYVSRLHDVLVDDYPKLARAVGEAFSTLSREYIHSWPSDRPSLQHFGRHMAAFLTRHPLTKQRPWLADLARLEWARAAAFDVADRSTMSFEDFRLVPTDQWGELHFELVPSVQLLALEWQMDEIWHALDDGQTPGPAALRPTALVVWRNAFTVRHRRCDEAEARAIALLARSAAFAEVCEAWPGADVVIAAHHAIAALAQWVADGWVASPIPTAQVPSRDRALD